MKTISKQWVKTLLAKVLVAVLLMMSVIVSPSAITKAATNPTLSKDAVNILEGKKYNLNVNNKIERSSYEWSSNDKKIATVTNKGLVTGVKKGNARITCKITTPNNSYELSCEVTVLKPAVVFTIKNKITALNLGQKYNLDRRLGPSTSNDMTSWSSSDETIAAPDKNGKFVALKEGTVTITGKTKSGLIDSVTITVVDKVGTVKNQSELETLLGSGADLITIKTTDAINFIIPRGDYSKQNLVVDAPNSDVVNNGTFASIQIKQIKANTWYEKAVGNLLSILASDSRIVVGAGASAKIEVNQEGAKLIIENNGIIKEIAFVTKADVEISGDSSATVPVVVNIPGIKITSSVPLNLESSQKFELTLLDGAEGTTLQAASQEVVPTISSVFEFKYTIGKGENAKEETKKPKPSEGAVATPTPEPTATPSPKPTSTPTPTPIVVVGDTVFDDLKQTEIVEVMGAGWNLGNQLEAVLDGVPGETNWGNPVITKELIDSIKEAGFNSIRIPVSYLKYIGAAPNYTVDEAWLDRVQEVVNYCVSNDMYAIINMHGDGYKSITGGWLICDSEDQETIKAKYEAVWEQIANRFKEYDEHLVFESMNEEFDGTYGTPSASAYANINAYNQIFINAVRQSGGNNDKRWVLIPGWNTDINYTVGNYGFVIPTDDYLSESIPDGEKRIMISVHYYAPWDFCGGESGEITQWGESATDLNKVSTHSGQSYMAAQFKSLYDSFTSKGYPVVIGEYGSIDKSSFDTQNTYYRAYFARKVSENSVKYGCIPVIWDNGYDGIYGFSLFNRLTSEVIQPEIIAAIMEVYNGSTSNGTSTGIILGQSEVDMVIGGAPVTLQATLTPSSSTDDIRWSSSDETVATISDSGIIRAYTLGATVITASANGHTAQCVVTVKESENVLVALYALETSSWSTIKSSANAELTASGGTYTLSLTGSQSMLSKIGALFIKDIQVQSNVASKSIFTGVKIKVDSVTFNGIPCTVTQTEAEQAVGSSGALDFSILNQWVPNSEKIQEATKSSSGSYEFTVAPYQNMNTIEVTFTVSKVVSPNSPPEEPEEPTEPSIVNVGLYAQETVGWSTLKSVSGAAITVEGGQFTLSLTGTRDQLSNLATLYLKDQAVYSGDTTKSIFTGAKIMVNSVKINGVDCTTNLTESVSAINNGVLDFTMLNQWSEGSEKINEVSKGSSGSYSFTGVTYLDMNTIDITFTISEVEIQNSTPTDPVDPVDPETPEEPGIVTVGLYAQETVGWSTLKSVSGAAITVDGGQFTLSLTGTRDQLSNLATLYLKDQAVYSGDTTKSIFTGAKIMVNSVKINGMDCTTKLTEPVSVINNGVLDYAMLNQWSEGSEKINEVTKGSSGSYYFTGVDYLDTNTFEITFTITNITVSN